VGAAAYAYKPQLRSPLDQQETRSRRQRRRRVKIVGSARKFVYCAIPLALLLLYVGLMAGLTVQTYRLSADQRAHATLLDRNNSLRSSVAQLESVERLQAVARRLHMTEPHQVAFITTPEPPQAVERPFALFVQIAAITRWFGVR
jgi:hypothetical protein